MLMSTGSGAGTCTGSEVRLEGGKLVGERRLFYYSRFSTAGRIYFTRYLDLQNDSTHKYKSSELLPVPGEFFKHIWRDG